MYNSTAFINVDKNVRFIKVIFPNELQRTINVIENIIAKHSSFE